MLRENKPGTLKSYFPQLSFKLVAVGILLMAALFIFIFLVHESVFQNEDVFDSRVSAFFSRFNSPIFVTTMQVFTFIGSSYFLLPAYIVLAGYFLIKKNRSYSINIALMGIASTAVVHALKLVFHRHRPEISLMAIPETYSFPSGHTVSSLIFCAILGWLVWQGNLKLLYKYLILTLLFLCALTIGVSRIVLGAHYPSDVLAGFCLASAWIICAWWFATRPALRRNIPP